MRQKMLDRHPPTKAWIDIHSLYDQGKTGEALQRLKTLAATGDSLAAVEIAHLYELGSEEVAQDFEESRRWYERAAFHLNDPKALLALGRIYYGGVGVQSDYSKALDFFKKCESSEPGALFAIGMMYTFGHGVAEDPLIAMDNYRRAAKMGHLLALKNLGLLQIKTGIVFKGLWNYLRAVFQIFSLAIRNPDDWRLRIA